MKIKIALTILISLVIVGVGITGRYLGYAESRMLDRYNELYENFITWAADDEGYSQFDFDITYEKYGGVFSVHIKKGDKID